MRQLMVRGCIALALGAEGLTLSAQEPLGDLLAPYLPSPQIVVEKMLEAAHVLPGEWVYDLGCGDGRVVITAAQKYRAHAVGIEIQEMLVKRTSRRVRDLGLESQVSIVHANALHYDLSDADVVTLFPLTKSNERLRPQFERQLKPGARVVSYAFEVPGWRPVRVETFQTERISHRMYVYEIQGKRKPFPPGTRMSLTPAGKK